MITQQYIRVFAGFASLMLLSLSLSHATVLTFDNLNLPSGAIIPDNYGNRVSSAGVDSQGRAGFDLTYGATPNVAVEMYAGYYTRDNTIPNYRHWHRTGNLQLRGTPVSGLGAYHQENLLLIFLEADNNYLVVVERVDYVVTSLNGELGRVQFSLQLGETRNYNQGGYGHDFPYFQSNVGQLQRFQFGAPIYKAPAAVIILTYTSNMSVVIDNIAFRQEYVPEPASLLALGAGLAGLTLRRRKR